MIDARELRIGNWVKIRGLYEVQVNDLIGLEWFSYMPQQGCNYKDTEPIPLTPEILERCGFSHEEKESRINDMKLFHVYTKGSYTFNSSHGWWFNGKQLDNQPKYLHQLQNLYFATEAEELTYQPI